MNELIVLGREGMGCEMEIEFALDLEENPQKSVFNFLQIRPIVTASETRGVEISEKDRNDAVLYSDQSLGHGLYGSMRDIIYVKSESFDTGATNDIASEIGMLNGLLDRDNRKFLLIGFGRWGTADPWLGIPVQWHDISGVGAIVEIQGHGVMAEPSQGSHFFQNITSLGIPYLMVQSMKEGGKGSVEKVKGMDWIWIKNLDIINETKHVCHVRLDSPLILKVNGYTSESVLLAQK